MTHKKIKLAAVFNQAKLAGGGFNEAINNALRLNKIAQTENIEVLFIITNTDDIRYIRESNLSEIVFDFTRYKKLLTFFHRLLKHIRHPIFKNFKSPFEKFLNSHDVDLVYFLAPNSWAQDLSNTNYIYTLWDNCHRDENEFPEVRFHGEFEKREHLNNIVLKKANAIITDSDSTIASIIARYGANQDRLYTIPFRPSPFLKDISDAEQLRILKKNNLVSKKYLFYPAQYWPHKNHIYIIEALGILKENYPELNNLNVIFCGSDKGNRYFLESYTRSLGLSSRVRFLGFVSDDEVSVFYKNCLALVMPTYFGPSNLPPLEAMKFGAPVIYPNFDTFKEFLGGAGLHIDLANPESLVEVILRLSNDTNLRNELTKLGYRRISELDNSANEKVLTPILKKFIAKRSCWE